MEEELAIQPPPVRIEIDLNSRSRDGFVLSRLSRATGPVEAEDAVVVFEPDDRVAAPARVVRVDRQHGFVFLDVDWSRLENDVVYGTAPRTVVDGWGQLSNAASPSAMRLGARGGYRITQWTGTEATSKNAREAARQ